jgi:hypothetical protein
MFGLDKYQYRASKSLMVYSFISQGPKGAIQKVAKFSDISPNIYNFGFGDLDPATGDISDTVISNNSDTEVVMGTLGSILYDFTNLFMEALIFFQGTSTARTRFYQMQIGRHWERIDPVFEVWGLKEGEWEHFQKGENYKAFLGRRKGAFLLPAYSLT